MLSYQDFLVGKQRTWTGRGHEATDLPAMLFDWQRAIVKWAVKKGCAAIFADCGLGNGVRADLIRIVTMLEDCYQCDGEGTVGIHNCPRCGGSGRERQMIEIGKSGTADTRTCDFANVSKETLYASSQQHIGDVQKALSFFAAQLVKAVQNHDPDKLTDIDGFHADFVTGFKQTGWWDRHRKLNRHHLTQDDGIPADVNLIDVLDFISDCVMAGMARSGSVYALHLSPVLLERAFQNTVELLKREVVVVE